MAETVYSCPACWSWQLHVDYAARVADGTFTSMKQAEEITEKIVRDHVAYECPHPRLIQVLLRERASRN